MRLSLIVLGAWLTLIWASVISYFVGPIGTGPLFATACIVGLLWVVTPEGRR